MNTRQGGIACRFFHLTNSAKAIIIQDGLLLAIEHADSYEKWLVLSGDGQNHGEILLVAVRGNASKR